MTLSNATTISLTELFELIFAASAPGRGRREVQGQGPERRAEAYDRGELQLRPRRAAQGRGQHLRGPRDLAGGTGISG